MSSAHARHGETNRSPMRPTLHTGGIPRDSSVGCRLGELNARLFEGQGLTIMLGQQRFVVKSVDMRRAAMHEEEDDAFGSRPKMSRMRLERVLGGAGLLGGGGLSQEIAKREGAKSRAAALQQLVGD